MNFVLKENFFSLKNFMDIHSESLFKYLKKIRDALRNHINGCEVLKITFYLFLFVLFLKKEM